MIDNGFKREEDVAMELGISKSHAYKIMQKPNTGLKKRISDHIGKS